MKNIVSIKQFKSGYELALREMLVVIEEERLMQDASQAAYQYCHCDDLKARINKKLKGSENDGF